VREETADEIKSIPEDGVNINGMVLEGCGWDIKNNSVVESERK
jgi:Dynein heavy chain C-terminal domain